MKADKHEVRGLPFKQRLKILDEFGEILINTVRDHSLKMSMSYATGKSVNQIKANQYNVLSQLSEEQKEKVNDLLSETITDVIFEFLHMIDENPDKMELIIKKDGVQYNYCDLTEHAGSEIACFEDDGWIQRFSKIGRFVL